MCGPGATYTGCQETRKHCQDARNFPTDLRGRARGTRVTRLVGPSPGPSLSSHVPPTLVLMSIAPPTTRKIIFPSVVWTDAPTPLTTWGDPRLTTDRWVQGKLGAISAARACALTHWTQPGGDWNLLRPPALWDREQLGKKQGTAGAGRTGNGGNKVNPRELALIPPGLPRHSILVQPAESNSTSPKRSRQSRSACASTFAPCQTSNGLKSSPVILGPQKSAPTGQEGTREKARD